MIFIKKITKFFQEHYYFLIFFLFLLFYSIIISGHCETWRVDSITYPYHVVDFSVGFSSRLLPGAIYTFLFENYNYESVSLYLTGLVIFCFLVSAFFLEIFIKSVEINYRKTIFCLIIFFLSGPFTFAIYINKFGMLDFYWLTIAALFMICLSNKKTYLFIIPLFISSVFIHFSVLLNFVPAFAIIMLCKVIYLKNQKEKRLLFVILIVSCIFAIGFALYFAFFERDNLNFTLEEFNEFLISRGCEYLDYYDYSFYRDNINHDQYKGWLEIYTNEKSTFYNFISLLNQQIFITLALIPWKDLIRSLFLVSPLIVFYFDFLKSQIKMHNRNIPKKFLLFLIIVLFFTSLLGCFFSTDVNRWLSHSFFNSLICIFYYIYRERDLACQWLHLKVSSIQSIYIFMYFILYATSIANAYS